MREPLIFLPLRAEDVLAADARAETRMAYGLPVEYSLEDAQELADQPAAWAAWRGDELLAVFGIYEAFPRRQGWCWAMLGEGIGASHLELTRFVAQVIVDCPLPRLEFYAKAADVEHLLHPARHYPAADIVAMAMAEPTRECRWALLLGMRPSHLLRRFGAADESYMLFERILPRRAAMQDAA